ncbi:MarR family winged helix-turn-helix transcriptional regulator [Microbacterium sp. STN6]|uniref:MarR family winged helix-turn-helix transcriptional regulator n=1 Tax=Microbacterium sp. STN6 TaxID=2995588 RepID=UPI0022608E2B|nr:MarR family winged helix-turn-helix transcriptional regulator [Microbacterium sp. STN6]MCX7522786.1 MarR family winged helix-turn-helix transcriptional regulator [Microbacterium sp. STN6]
MTADAGEVPSPGQQPEPEPEPDRHTGFLIRRAQQRHVAAWTRIVSTEISSVQYSILVALERRHDASQRELGDDVDLDRSTVADLVARMERRGLIERRRDPADRRRNTLTLTEHGLAERHRLWPLVEQVQRELTGSLSAESLHALRDALRQLLSDRP